MSATQVSDPDIQIDGRLDEPIWQQAAVLNDFTQYEPVEGIPATQPTEVLVLYSSEAIYFGIRAFDSEPELILGRLGERDRVVFGDDWVRIMLDTFDDQRRAYVFYVNPLGLQTDGLWIEGIRTRPGSNVSIDFNPDFIWESDGRITDEGWFVEIKIPYVSLRFNKVPVQDWGIQVAREVKRKRFKQSWAPLTQNVSSTLAQSGRLVQLQDLQSRRLVEFKPEATARRTGQAIDGLFQRENVQPDLGVNARIGITQNLVLDLAVNPDFSQVEADANRITVNERFALFFPERRSFFLEGSEIFRTPRNLVHTRQIADPSGGAKLSGKIGAFSVGYLGAVDRAPTTLLGGDNVAYFNLFRIRRDVGMGSNVGLLYTDRTVSRSGGFNRVFSGDARFLFLGRYTLTTQVAGSWTNPGAGQATTVAPLVSASLTRSGRQFEMEVKVDDVHPGFNTQSGFIPRIGDTQAFGRVKATHFGKPGAVLERVSGTLQLDSYFDHHEFWRANGPFEGEVQFMPSLVFRGDRTLTFILRDGLFRFRPGDYANYEVLGADGTAAPFALPSDLTHMLAVGFIPRLRVTNQVQLNGLSFLREVPIFAEAARGLELQVAPEVTLRPTSAIEFSAKYTYSRLWRTGDNSVYSTVNLPRIRTQYQFNRAIFVRVIVQYAFEERDALKDPTTGAPILIDGALATATRTGRFEGQFLATYEPSPGTIFFIGYSRLMTSVDRTYRLSRMDLAAEGLFAKLSYLFRL